MKIAIAAGLLCIAAAPIIATLPSAGEPTSSPVPKVSGGGLGQYAQPAGEVEGFAAYVPQASCDPKWRKGIRAFRDLVMKTYPETEDWGSRRDCTDDGVSEHLDGRAWDWHADVKDPKAFAAATDLINWLMAEGPDGEDAYWARRLGIMYIGYNHRIWGSYRASEGWRRLNNSNPHTDHVHFSFSWAGAFGKTSFWDGTPAAEDYGPCRVYQGEPAPLHTRTDPTRRPCGSPPPLTRTSTKSGPLLWRGSESAEVLAVQKTLGVGAPNSYFGPKTMRAVADYQRRKSLPVTGAVDTLTRAALVSDGVLKG
ncbi:MAG: peptidoglycan-binding protein [Candidatus Nanopelagicales bacterium]|jgi:peptidoglycan hydrolase-like protein with peptidoglycan-binding domain|nr:peptidoglycan-binding protein [Candidatus Nanopelagicales bacterium]MCU0298871.1 peptidoglycan-binding protein [Candidatus Nanopelagicales bacterium]